MNPYTGDEELDSVVREKVEALPKELRRVLDDQATEIYIRTFGVKAGLSEEQTDKLVSEVIMLLLGVTPIDDFALILMTELDMVPRLAFAVESWVTGTLLHEAIALIGKTGDTTAAPIPEPMLATDEASIPTLITLQETQSEETEPVQVPIPISVQKEPVFQPPVPSIQSKPVAVATPILHEVFIQRHTHVPTLQVQVTQAQPVPVHIVEVQEPVTITAPAPAHTKTTHRLTITHAEELTTQIPIPAQMQHIDTPPPPKLVIPQIKIAQAPKQETKTPLQTTQAQSPKIYTILSDIERFKAGMASSGAPRYAIPLTETPKY